MDFLVCFCFLQKVVEEEESQVKKSSTEVFSPASKQGEPDPVRKVSRWFPSFRPFYLSQPIAPASYHVFSLPPSATQRSALRVTVPTLTDIHTPCSPIHSSTLLLSDLSENTPIRRLKAFPVHLPHHCTHIHTRTHPELIPDDPLFTCMHAYITFIRL